MTQWAETNTKINGFKPIEHLTTSADEEEHLGSVEKRSVVPQEQSERKTIVVV